MSAAACGSTEIRCSLPNLDAVNEFQRFPGKTRPTRSKRKLGYFLNPRFGEPLVCTWIPVVFIVSFVSVISANPQRRKTT